MAEEITSSDDTIDTRSARDRLEELLPYKVISETAKTPYQYIDEFATEAEARDAIDGEYADRGGLVVDEWHDEARELASLLDLKSQVDAEAWSDDTELIGDDHFKAYVQDLYDDDVRAMPLILTANIDWKGVAEDEQMDYTSLTWQGATFWYKH